MVEYDMMESIPGVIIYGIIFFLLAMAMLFFVVSKDVNIEELEAGLLMRRLYYSSDCFAYEDVRSYPGVIDMDKFNGERLNSCLETDYYVNVKIGDYRIYNKEGFEDKRNFCKYEQYDCFFSEQLVLVDNKKEIMEIGVIMENV